MLCDYLAVHYQMKWSGYWNTSKYLQLDKKDIYLNVTLLSQ